MVAEATSARAGHQGEGYEDAMNGQQDAEGQEEPAAQHGALLPREGGVLGLYPGPWTLPWGGGGGGGVGGEVGEVRGGWEVRGGRCGGREVGR